MDLHYSQTNYGVNKLTYRFTTLWIYTILKLPALCTHWWWRFTTLWIYTILKLVWIVTIFLVVSLPYGFTLFSNSVQILRKAIRFHYLMDLHYSQTAFFKKSSACLFHYLMDLHYSQTYILFVLQSRLFHYLMDLHYSQTTSASKPLCLSFTTLWIYTILKRVGKISLRRARFTTLWIYTILKRTAPQSCCGWRFTTLWIYTILKRS